VDWLVLLVTLLSAASTGWVGHYLWARRKRESFLRGTNVPPVETDSGTNHLAADARFEPESAPPHRAAATEVTEVRAGAGLARRVVVHLHSLGRLGTDDVAPVGFTQQGMVVALGVRQGTIVRVLQGLEAAGVLTVARRHVRGIDHRLKVYQLTARGEALARDALHGVNRTRTSPLFPRT
jgi:hypothetical protein